MQKLIIEDDEGRTTVVPLVREELTIGRREGNTIRLTERNVSRQHARLFKKSGAVFVEDLGSYTGVRVNGVRIEAPAPLKDGDQVSIGDYKLSVKSEAAQASAPAPAPPAPTVVDNLPAVLAEATAQAPARPAVPASNPQALTVPAPDVDGAPSAADAAPTIPVRTLAEQARAAERPRSPPLRLVVVTTNLGGMEFRVDRPSMVIGRTEENDIIINHPSISRHHAKIVCDGDRYTVVDLQSANGVRVGGESYERVDVQPGDVVELGHVKLRLVGADETWTYDPQEYSGRSRRGLKIGAAVGGVALALGVIAVLQLRKEPAGEETAAQEPGKPGAATDSTAAAAAPAATAPAAPRPSPEDLLAQATAAATDEKWDQSVTTLDLLLDRVSADPAAEAVKARAAALKKKVDLERRSVELFTAFEEAAKAREPDLALSRFESIPEGSLYRARAEESLPEVKTQFLAAHMELAEAARDQGHCEDARAEVEKVIQVDPENRKAHSIAKGCKGGGASTARVAVAVAPSASRPAPRAARAAATPRSAAARGANADEAASGSEGAGPPDPADLIRQARAAWLRQQCSQAIDLSRKALRAKGNANEAHQIIAVCACSLKDRDGAQKSYARLDERNRSMVRSICLKNGVELEE
jgi:pSer/pThr/pTyr-binding forkhead associated (FHA) protein